MPDEIIEEQVTEREVEFSEEQPVVEFAVQREAKLFEAGDYPDKGVSISESDLDTIVANHVPDACPIKIEHENTPFDGVLGSLTSIYRRGKELFGSLSFTDAAWQLLQTTKHRGLSCGIRPDKSGIAEVSLVRQPRIASAQVFSEGVVGFNADLPWFDNTGQPTKEVRTMPDEVKTDEKMTLEQAIAVIRSFTPESSAASAAFSATNEMAMAVKMSQDELLRTASSVKATMREIQRMNTETDVTRFKREGYIKPVAEKYARALLACRPLTDSTAYDAEVIPFREDDGTESMVNPGTLFAKFLEANGQVINFREITLAGEEDKVPGEALDMFSKLGVDPTSETSRKVLAEMRR